MPILPLAHISWAIADNASRTTCDAFFIDLFGAQTAYEVLITPETEKYRLDREERLMVIGDTMFVPIAPAGHGVEPGNPLGDMLRRAAGPNKWLGMAFRAADLKQADAWFRSRGFALHYDPGMENHYFLISRGQALGIRIEIMQGELPSDPRLLAGWNPMRWRDDHPLGIEGLLSVDVSTESLDDARHLFAERLQWPQLSERSLPGEDARGLAFDAGDVVVEALRADDPGSALAEHARSIRGVCGVTFKVRSAKATADHLRARGFTLIGSPATRFAIVPQEAQYRLIWFCEAIPDGWPAPHSLMRSPAGFPKVGEQARTG